MIRLCVKKNKGKDMGTPYANFWEAIESML